MEITAARNKLNGRRPVFSAPNYTLQLGYADNVHGCTAPATGTTTCFPNPFDGSNGTKAAALWALRSISESTISHQSILGLTHDPELLLCNMQRSHGERVYPLLETQQ